MIALPDVTLFVIHGGPAVSLFQYALERTLERIQPAALLIFTSEPEAWSPNLGGEIIRIPRCYSAKQAMQIFWYRVPLYVKTSHMMHVEWDGWVLDETAWSADFLNYDYIGAPWPWHRDDYKVGNGLGLRSQALMSFLSNHKSEYPLPQYEDHTLCREYRPRLEKEGFLWPSVETATRFSWERGERPQHGTFMFHGAFNFPHVLNKEEFDRVKGLADAYVLTHPSWVEMRHTGVVA